MVSSNSKVAAIIQARMGSTRFPGKMLAKLEGESLLYHIISRSKQLESADVIILATTDLPRDDPLEEIADSFGIKTIRGSENNVLSRFLLGIDASHAEIVIRICGDAPLFDPSFLDKSIALLKESDADLITIRNNVPVAYQGASAISSRALRWTWEVGRGDPLAYEHVTAYAMEHSGLLRSIIFDPDPEFIGNYHFSIDTKADLHSIRKIYNQLYIPGQIVQLKDAIRSIKLQELNNYD